MAMFSNSAKLLVTLSPFGQICGTFPVRGMATLAAISYRLKSVRNIQKITRSMKMVSAAKYARAERELKLAYAFGEGSQSFYEAAEVTPPESAKKELVIAMTSDKGLCGGVHSSVARRIRPKIQKNPDGIKLVCIGDKSRAMLARTAGNKMILSVKEIGRIPPTFRDASLIASAILTSEEEYETGCIVYNKSSRASYTTTETAIFDKSSIYAAPKISLYDSLDAEIMQSYLEFSLASQLYYAMKESATSEQSARMTAMDNSSRNAGEMIDKLQIEFNRKRQDVITGELIEIISGAAALE